MSKARSGGERGGRGRSGRGRGGLNGDFAEVLATLIQAHDSSARALAVALDLDVSLVYKWLRRERTPALISGHPEAIAQFLNLDASERAALRAAQERSLAQGSRKTSVPRRVMALIGNIVTREAKADAAATTSDGDRRTPALPPDQPVLHTREDVQLAVLNVIGGALAPDACGDTMLCTFQGEGLGPFDGDLSARWQEAMQRALRNRWRIEHIWRLNRDLQRSVSLVDSTLDLLGAGEYHPLYIDAAETLSPPYDLIIRPDRALVMLATQNTTSVDAAIVTHDQEQIRLWRDHYQQLRALARPPLQRFLPKQSTAAGAVLTKTEEQFPGRVFVKYGLSLITEPASWCNPSSHWARLIQQQGFDVPRFLEYRSRRLAAFQRHVRTAIYRDICPEQAVELMVETGVYLANGQREPLVEVPPEARREHLLNVIRLLREQENYHLALVPDDALARVRISPDTFWEVLGGTQAMLNTPTQDARRRAAAMDVVITEPQIAAAFQFYFDSLWERIPPLNRDRRYVIWWLERQLEKVPA